MPKRIITPSSIRNGTKNEAIYRRADLRMKNLETSEKYDMHSALSKYIMT